MNTVTQGRVDMHILGKVTDHHYMGTIAQAEVEILSCSTYALKAGKLFRFNYDPKNSPIFEEGDTIGLRLKGNRFLGYNVLGIMRGIE